MSRLAVWTHRLVLDPEAGFTGTTADAVLTRVLGDVPTPVERRAG